MQRGQCSIVSQLALGVIVSPHRGQFKWIVPATVEGRLARLEVPHGWP
jgi:hypothetical protein